MTFQGKINTYTCDSCRERIVTVDRDEGTTPMILACRATAGCRGRSQSGWYRVAQDLTPGWEWYKPTGDEYRRLSRSMRDHVDRGGLDIRRIDPVAS